MIDSIFTDQFQQELNQHYLQNKIVRKPDLLFKVLESGNFEELANILTQCSSIQALVLTNHQNETLIDKIFTMYLKEESPEIVNHLMKIINWFLTNISLTKRNYKTLFSYIKDQMYANQLNEQKLSQFLMLLQKVFELQCHQTPYATFYFNSTHSGLVVDTREMNWAFNKGLTFQTWLYPMNQNTETKLFYLMSDKKKGCQLLLNNNKLIYQYIDLNSPNNEIPLSLMEIPSLEWSQLCVQIQLKKLFLSENYYLFVNLGNHQLREIKIDFPHINNDSQVMELQFYNNFYGFASCILLYNDGFDGNPLSCGSITYGIQNNEHLRSLQKQKLILCYTPLRTRANFITDPINKFDGALQSYSGSYIRYTQKQQFSQFCRMENFVPLLLFLRISPYDSLLNELLQLFDMILSKRQEAQQDAVRTELLSLITIKVNDDGLYMINHKTIELLAQLYKNITHQKLKEQFISMLLWRIQIYRITDIQIFEDYLQFVRMLYNENPDFCISVFGINKILEILIYDIDPKNRLCCEEHANQMGYEDKIENSSIIQLQMKAYLNIIDAILYQKLFHHIEKQSIVDIARVFTLKCSPCFYQLLLKKLQGLFQYETKENNQISQILIQEQVMQMLLSLLTTCSCPDVKTSCIKLIAESIRINNTSNEQEIANWIAHTLGNSAAIEVEYEIEQEQPRKPPINQALKFHQGGDDENSLEETTVQTKSQLKLPIQQRVIDYEPLYVAIMEWMLRARVSKTNSDTFILDENYVIKSSGGLTLLINYYQYCMDSLKGRIMQDLCMLVKWNQQSALFLLQNEEFHWWIVETLLEMQKHYNQRELTQFEFWVWDSGLKLYCNIIKSALLTEKQGYLRLAQLHSYCKVLQKDTEITTQLLIRLIFRQLLTTFSDCYKQDLMSVFWINIYSVVFEAFRLVVADPLIIECEHDFLFKKFTNIQHRLTISQQEMPKKWKQQFGNIQWIDHIYVINLCEIINQYCNKFSTQIIQNIDDYQLVQKGIFQIIESSSKNNTELQKTFGTLLYTFNFGQDNFRGPCFVQVCQMFLQLSSEYFAFNVHSSDMIKQFQVLLNTQEKLLRTLIISAETVRTKEIEEWQDNIVYQVIGSYFHFLFNTKDQIQIINYDSEIKSELLAIINQTLLNSFKFLIIYIDSFSTILGKNESYQVLIFEGYKNYKMYVARMLKDLIKKDSQYIFEVNEAKSLKLNNKLIQKIIEPAQQVFIENLTLLQKIEQFNFLNEEFYLLMKCDFEDACRVFEQRLKQLQDTKIEQRQAIEEVLFTQMVQETTTYSYDQKIQRIDTEQIWIRQARYMFKRAFNRVRVFNQWWTHPNFKAQIDKPFDAYDVIYDNIEQNEIFSWKMWKYETKQKSRPLLKPKLYDYPEAQITHSFQQNSRIMNLVDYDLKQPQIKIVPKFHQKIIATLDPLKLFTQDENDDLIVHHVQWIKTLTVRIGSLRICNGKLTFYYESINQKETHQSLIKFKVPENSQLVKQWALDQIYDIQHRRYIGRWTSLEITLLEGSTLVFNFVEDDYKLILERLISLKKVETFNLKPRVLTLKLTPLSIIQETKAINKWYNYKITTFEYLMKLNKISGRSNKDLTQYPVFPWIMNDGEILHKFRDLSKSMGALGSKERIEIFEQRYNMIDHFNKVPQYHYGSHYSSPAIIFHYLIRLRPFSDGAKELQSGKFDLADRLFFSVVETYRNAIEELSDVRELIPEFFYLPEMFLNLQKYDYGLQQTGQRVNNVELPQWTEQNPYIFTCLHRMELESDTVSQHISHWIDLIFGYKQKGEEAVKALNTFYYLTYEDSLDWKSITNEKQKISLESQAIHFGQCPSQILKTPHPMRPKPKIVHRIVDEKFQQRVLRSKSNDPKQLIFNRNRAIIKISFISDHKLLVIRRNGECSIAKIEKHELKWEKEPNLNLDKLDGMYINDWTCHYDELPIVTKGKQIFVGGAWDGRLLIWGINGQQVEQYFEQENTITTLRLDYKGRILATGSKDGTLVLYKCNQPLSVINKHHNHDQPITDIFICDDLRAVFTCSTDGWIHMYNQWSGKYLRSYHHPKGLPISKVCSFCTPLYGIAFYENKNIYSYSINGQFLAHYQLKQYIVNQGHMKVVKDSKLCDLIVVPLCMEKKILILTTPFLQKRYEIQLTDNISSMNDVSSFSISPDRTILVFGTSDGELGLVIDQRQE